METVSACDDVCEDKTVLDPRIKVTAHLSFISEMEHYGVIWCPM